MPHMPAAAATRTDCQLHSRVRRQQTIAREHETRRAAADKEARIESQAQERSPREGVARERERERETRVKKKRASVTVGVTCCLPLLRSPAASSLQPRQPQLAQETLRLFAQRSFTARVELLDWI